MRSLSLLPYCPLPVNTGARAVFMKHLNLLGKLGDCTILSARNKPVGFGWSGRYEKMLQLDGFDLAFRPNSKLAFKQWYGMAYAFFFKCIRQENAFGHSNPYHRYAFDSEWLYQKTSEADLCEIHYSYWARLATACPKVVIIHDLWSDIMRGNTINETKELATADLLVTVSHEDKIKLEERGLKNVHWSPPCVAEHCFSDSSRVAVVGSGNEHNVEGIKWLQHATTCRKDKIHCYGAISKYVLDDECFIAHGSYKNNYDPFAECGISLMLTKGGTGTQIKGIEALACGRAIIARKGAMRGLPRENIGWIEVGSPSEMMEKLYELESDTAVRQRMMRMARSYYHLYLEKSDILSKLESKYCEIVK